MQSLWNVRRKDRQRAVKLPKSIAEQHVGLRHHLGDGIFLMANGDLAVVYEMHGIADEPLTEEQLKAHFYPLVKFVRSLVRGIPSHEDDGSTVVQIICKQRQTTESPSSEAEEQNRASAIMTSEEAYLFAQGLTLRRFFLTVRWTPPAASFLTGGVSRLMEGMKQSFSSESQFSRHEAEHLSEKRKLFLRELRNKEIESQVAMVRLTPAQVIAHYNDVLGGGSQPMYDLGGDEATALHEDIINPKGVGRAEGFDFEGGGTLRVFTFSQLPSRFALGRMRLFMDSLPLTKFDLALTLSHGSKVTDSLYLLKKLWFSQGPANEGKFQDLIEFEREISAQNPKAAVSLRLVCYDITDEEISLVQSCAVDTMDCPIILEDGIGWHLIATSLLMNCDKEGHAITGRFRTVHIDRAIAFAPIYTAATSAKGHRAWISRNGMPIKFDIFAGSGNKHLCILGGSEGGKSCLTAQFIIEFLARFPKGVVRVIDKKTSYKKIADLLGGSVVAFSESFLKENPYSPFSCDKWTGEDIEDTVAFLHNSIEQLNPLAEVSSVHLELISQAMKKAYLVHAETARRANDATETYPHFVWGDVKRKLPIVAKEYETDVSAELDDILRWTITLDEASQYGYLFNRYEKPDKKSSSARLLCYDLDGISDPRLKVMATQLTFLKVARDLYKLGKDVPKLIIFEELGVLLKGDSKKSSDMARRFVENMVKTARKLEAMAVGITNELEDFVGSEGGRAFWNVARQKLFLPMEAAAHEHIAKLEELTAADVEIIRDLHIEKGKYSQAYLISSSTKFKGSFLIPLSPSMNALVTTNGLEVALYERLREDGHSVEGALDLMAKDFPYGRGLGHG